jgi:hypothetical protein
MQGVVQAGKPNEVCIALQNKRVRVIGTSQVGVVANVCPDKLGAPYQVHVKVDGDDSVTVLSPDEIEAETLQ